MGSQAAQPRLLPDSGTSAERITRLWEQQRRFNFAVRGAEPDVAHTEWVSRFALGAHEELAELLKHVNWKAHRKPLPWTDPDRDNQANELADLTKYVLSLWQQLGFGLEEALEAVETKGLVVEQRWVQEHSRLRAGQPVLLADLDGSVADFAGAMLAFLAGRGVNVPETWEQDSLSLETLVRLPYPEFWHLKRTFEAEGGYAQLEPYPDAIELLREAQAAGWAIYITTARPPTLSRVFRDSLLWLRKYDIQPDRLELLGNDRALLAYELTQSGHRVVALEDDPTQALRLAEVCSVLLRLHRYNDRVVHPNIQRATTFASFMLHDWQQEDF